MSGLIGLTYASDATRARGCGALPVGTLAALFTDASTNRVRLALDCLFSLPAFLPIARGDLEAATSWIADNSAALETALHRLAGQCELVLTLEFPGEPPPAAGSSGRDWLQGRSASHRASAAAVSRSMEKLRAIAAPWLPEDTTTMTALRRSGRAGAELCVLTPIEGHRRLADRLLQAAHSTLSDAPEAQLRLSGPWPPYGFAGEALARADGTRRA